MELSRNCCRICVSESEFNISLFGSYCRRTQMIDKILVCLKIVIEESDRLNTICYKCTENIERYYDFIMSVKKSQTKLWEPRQIEGSINRKHVTYMREQIIEQDIADCTFSFIEPHREETPKQPTQFFPYLSVTPEVQASPPKVAKKSVPLWPREVENTKKRSQRKMPRHKSVDIFESQEIEDKPHEWSMNPVTNILKRARDKCFGRSEF